MFQSKRWVGIKINVTIPKLVAIFKREIFLNIEKSGTV
jgi:sRNA-binding carbon storage regulator CsrA